MKNQNRTTALAWWNSLTEVEKQLFFNGYKNWTASLDHTELTGREIQNIWAVHKSQ